MFGITDFFEFEFLRQALLALFCLSLLCGILSPIVVSKKLAFIGEGISHSTLLGLSISLYFFSYQDGLGIYFLTLLITGIIVLFLAWGTYQQKIPEDSLIGIFLTTSLALGIILFQFIPDQSVDLFSFLFGNLTLITNFELVQIFIVLLFILSIFSLKYQNWLAFIFDEEGAQISGLPTKNYHYLLYLLLTLTIISAIKIAGTLLVNTLLIIPGVFAYKVSRSMKGVIISSILFSIIAASCGLILSNAFNTPPGATLALTQFLFLLLGSLWVKIRS